MKENKNKWVDPQKTFVVHEDILTAFQGYDGDPDHFKKVFKERDEAIANGEVYWNTDHDVEMAETARERSQQPGWEYPRRKK